MLLSDDTFGADFFGSGLAFHNNNLIVGAEGAGPGGAAYIFKHTPATGDWLQTRRLTNPESDNTDDFGFVTAIYRATAVAIEPLGESQLNDLISAGKAFATILNADPEVARNCTLNLSSPIDADFFYQNTPVDITAGGAQPFFFGITPNEPIDSTDVEITYQCDDMGRATIFTGVNTLCFSGAATSNIGIGADIEVTAEVSDPSLPMVLTICETDASSGCIDGGVPEDSVSLTIGAGGQSTFAVFARATGAIAFDPRNNRINLLFREAGVLRGSTSTAVRFD